MRTPRALPGGRLDAHDDTLISFRVLRALGVAPDLARSSLRFSLGRFTTADEIGYAAGKVSAVVTYLRRHSAAFELEAQENSQVPDWTAGADL